MEAALLEALRDRDVGAVLEPLREDCTEIPVEAIGPLLDAWSWMAEHDRAAEFAELALLVLGVHRGAASVGVDWVESVGLEMAMRGAEDGDADTATKLAGVLLSVEPNSELALDLWLEAVADGDGYFDPDSMEDAVRGASDPERADLLCALERLVAYSLAAEHWDEDRALEHLLRDTKSHARRLTRRGFERAKKRLSGFGFTFSLPSEKAWARVDALLRA